MQEKKWKIGIYIRLSREDIRCGLESESVTNQRKVNLEYIKEHMESCEIIEEYVDDGHSGTTEESRPGFQRLCRDISSGKINCVVCKTLSRAFRNYADQGHFLEEYLPALGCRFIAVGSPHVDTFTDPDCMAGLEIPINGLLNDRYAAKTSEDVRRTFAAKRKKGEFIGAFAPYGYQKSPKNRNLLVPDPEAARVVQKIFAMFLAGMSRSSVVRCLNEERIPCPTLYKHEKLREKYRNPHVCGGKPPLWSSRTIGEILRNPTYCGDMVQGKCRVISYKLHVRECIPREKWVVVSGTHEAIVSREDFERAGELLKRRIRGTSHSRDSSLFGGFLRCMDCGEPMVRNQSGGYVYYYCRTYRKSSGNRCTSHGTRQFELEKVVLACLNRQFENPWIPAAIDEIKHECRKCNPFSERLRKSKQELDQDFWYRRVLYEDWKTGELGEREYREMKAWYEKREMELNREILRLKREAMDWEERQRARSLEALVPASALSRPLLSAFIDQILIGKRGEIEIYFRFRESNSQPPLVSD